MAEYNILNASDNIIAPYITQDDFENSLVFNILFQDKLLVHEANFFASYFLANHLKKAKSQISLFEVAAREGLIVPAFRDTTTNTLKESFLKMVGNYGNDYILTNSAHNIDCLHRMCNSVDEGRRNAEAFFWPSNIILGESYYDTLKTFLQAKELPKYICNNDFRHSKIEKYWKATEKWRYELLQTAYKNTIAKGELGIQRTEIMKAMAVANNVSSSIALNSRYCLTDYIKNPVDKKNSEVFIKWISQCYHINISQAFNSSLNFPVYNSNEDFMCESIAKIPDDISLSTSEGFSSLVKLPSLKRLLEEHPSNLISIRKELGYSYLKELNNWQENPNEYNMQVVKILFEEYCARICERYSDGQVTLVKSHYGSSKDIKREGFDLTSSILSNLNPAVSIFSSIFKNGFAIYEFFSDRKGRKPLEKKLEINLSENSNKFK